MYHPSYFVEAELKAPSLYAVEMTLALAQVMLTPPASRLVPHPSIASTRGKVSHPTPTPTDMPSALILQQQVAQPHTFPSTRQTSPLDKFGMYEATR